MKKIRVASFLLALALVTTTVGGCAGSKKDLAGEEIKNASENDMSSAEMQTEGSMEYDSCDMEKMQTEEYRAVTENGFLKTELHPLSTFSADVDTASYSNVRRMLNQGMLAEDIPKGAVRIEEMLNYFHYDYETPQSDEVFGISIDGAKCPWQEEHGLLRVGIRTEDIDFSESAKSNLVFLLDVSGSMDEPGKAPLLKQAFALLVDNLGEKDRVSIVTYAGMDEVVLNGARGNEKGEILEALEYLTAGGGTNGSAGIETAYALAEEHFIEGGNNRIILATDGDLNIGQTSESELQSIVEEKRKSGVYLSVLGFGDGNLKDNKLETLADYGNGNYAYIDSLMEAKRVLVDELGSTLVTVAEDVKFQMEFNPAWISEYRLLGYENRLLNAEDFTDDTKDAGEVGAGHTVTALYEVVWNEDVISGKDNAYIGESDDEEDDIHLKYQTREPAQGEAMKEWATLKIRYKKPGTSKSREIDRAFGAEIYREDIRQADMLLAASVAEFGLLLSDSDYKGNSSYQQILDRWDNVQYGGNEEVAEFLQLVKLAGRQTEEPIDTAEQNGQSVQTEQGITLEVVEGTVTDSGASFVWNNPFREAYFYGEYYELEKWENGNWVKLSPYAEVGWNDIACILGPGEQQMDIQWDWGAYGVLEPGSYRIEKQVYPEHGNGTDREIVVTAEFKIPD